MHSKVLSTPATAHAPVARAPPPSAPAPTENERRICQGIRTLGRSQKESSKIMMIVTPASPGRTSPPHRAP